MARMGGNVTNPDSNGLRAGTTAAQLEEAIRRSGYPLQFNIANILRPDFSVEEEWGFVDATSGTTRTLDLMAESRFHDVDPNRFRVRPTLNLLVECKQSDLPYVFFLSNSTKPENYPRLVGLHNNTVTVTTDDDRSTWAFGALSALGLGHDVFLESTSICTTFSKCVRQGKDIELSGADAYNGLVMPLISAVTDFASRSKPPSTAYYFYARMVLMVAVLDAPMVGVRVCRDGERAVSFVPWVRLARSAPPADRVGFDAHSGEQLVIDVVHSDYFRTFLESHVVPFTTRFRDRAHKHHEELASGRAFVAGMGRNRWVNVEERMLPSTFSVAPPLRIHRGWLGFTQRASLLARWAIEAMRFKSRRLRKD
jgi:hypothetical protein